MKRSPVSKSSCNNVICIQMNAESQIIDALTVKGLSHLDWVQIDHTEFTSRQH